MVRWVPVALGCVSAFGLQIGLRLLVRSTGLGLPGPADYGLEFVALLLAGFVTGHLASQWQVINGTATAIAYILLGATITSYREAAIVRDAGLAALPPIDYVDLALGDFVALFAASIGAWLSIGKVRKRS